MKSGKSLICTLVAVMLLIALLLSACPSPPAEETTPPAGGKTTPAKTTEPPAKPIVLKFSSPYASGHPFSVADTRWMERIEEETGGRVQFEVYWGGSLISSKEQWQGLVAGIADCGFASASYESVGFDLFNKAIAKFFYGTPDMETGWEITKELYAKFPEIMAEYDGLKVLGQGTIPAYQIFTVNKAVRTLDDLKGLQIKCLTEHVDPLKEFGAVGMIVPMTETYVALQKATVDGMFGPYETLESFSFAEVVNYVTRFDVSRGHYPMRFIVWDCWNRLPPDIQKIMDDANEWSTLVHDEELEKVAQVGINRAKGLGVEFIELPKEDLLKFYDVLGAVALDAAAELDAKGLPGTDIFNETRRLVEGYIK